MKRQGVWKAAAESVTNSNGDGGRCLLAEVSPQWTIIIVLARESESSLENEALNKLGRGSSGHVRSCRRPVWIEIKYITLNSALVG